MAADADDYFQKVSRSTATTLSAPGYTIGNTTINVGSTANWGDETGATFAIDEVDSDGVRVSGTYNVFRGVVSSATQISDLTYVGGDPNRDYTAGATTRVYILVSAYRDNRLVDGLLVSHDQDGTLKAGAVDNAAVIANDVVDSQHYVAGSIDTEHIADGAVTPAKLLAGTGTDWAWQSWTPTLSGRFNDAKWTKSCRYIQIGKTVFFYLDLTANTTTPMDGGTAEAIFSLPVTSASYTAPPDMNILSTQTRLLDSGTAAFNGLVSAQTTTTAKIRVFNVASTYLLEAAVTSTAPFTWTTGDQIVAFGSFEAA